MKALRKRKAFFMAHSFSSGLRNTNILPDPDFLCIFCASSVYYLGQITEIIDT
jgi:hypothetical protein